MRVITANLLVKARRPVPAAASGHRMRACFAGVTVEVRSANAALIADLSARYAEHLSGAQARYVYSVCETPRGYEFYCDHDGVWEWGHGRLPPSALAFLTDATLMSSVVHYDPALVSIHAAAVSNGTSGAIITGDSTAGKTTTLLACARSGLRIFSDERALLRGNILQPFLRQCSVRDGGRGALLRDDPHDQLARILKEDAGGVSLRKCFGGDTFADPVPMRAVFVLAGIGDTAGVEPIESVHALPAISRWFDMRGDRFDAMARAVSLLRGAACFRLTLGTPAVSAKLIRNTLHCLP